MLALTPQQHSEAGTEDGLLERALELRLWLKRANARVEIIGEERALALAEVHRIECELIAVVRKMDGVVLQ